MTTDKVRLKQLQQQQQQLQYRHPGGFGTLPIQHYHQQQQQQQQQPQFRQFQHPDSDVERRRRPSSLIADGAGNIAEADDDEDSEEEGDCPERRPFMLPESNSSTAAVGAAVRDRGVPMSVGRLYAAPPPVTAAAGGGIGVQQQLTLDSGVESGNLSMKQRGSPAGGLGYRELAASGSGSADSNSPQQQQQQQQLLQFTSTGQRGAKHPLPPPPHPQHSGVAFPIPPPPSEPPPCTPRNSALVGSGNGNSHYAESGSLFGQGFYGQTVGDTFYLPPGQLPPYHGTGGVVNNNTTSLMRHHPQLLDGMLLSCGGPDSRQGVYDTAGSLENRGKPLSPTVPGPSSSGHQQHSSGPDGGDSSAASKMLMYHPQYGSGSSTKKCHRKRLHCSSRCSIAVLCLFVLILLPAVIYFIFRTVKLERQVSENFAQNTSLFGLFNPNSPPVPIRDGEVYRAVLGPSAYWSGQLDCSRSFYLVLNVSLPPLQVAGLYLRRNSLPTVVQYDFFHRLVNLRRRTRKIAKRETQPQQPPLNQQSVIRFLTPGIWYVSLINDQPEPMVADISAELTLRDFQLPNCLNQCSNRGQCTDGRCSCLVGFKGPDCSIPDEVEICSGNGYFDRGRCHCHAQWKGAECEVAWSECLDPLCSGNGRCEAGSCRCFEGFSGDRCQNLSCGPSNCHGRGVCGPDGHCRCFAGWRGADCQTPAASANEANERCPADSDTAVRLCSGRGRIVDGRCECDRGFSGDSCEFETCLVTCQHGDCVNGSCQCHLGWSGVRCQLRSCGGTSGDSCSGHGVCVNGTCACDKGWNGPRCSLDGCPQSCSNNGNCELDPSTGDWRCVCVGLNLWHGDACQYPVEQQCSDSADNDNDGLVDCNDPDCCNQPVCSRAESCSPGAYPQQVLLSEPSLPYVSSFERRVRFLIGKESVQLYSSMYFEPRFISVVTGTLVFRDSTPALACRVWDGQNALIGNTLSRPDGSFYLVVVGGRSLSLNIARVMASGQTLTREIRLHVPANSFLHMGRILLSTAGSLAPAGSAYPQLYPTAAPSSLHASLDSASAQPRCRHNYALLQPRLLFGGAPGLESLSGNGGINTATVQLERGTLRVRVPLPGAPLSLVYISSRAIGYQTGMPIQLTGAEVPPGLAEVVCYVSVGGSMLRRRFEAGPNLTYHFEWDRLDAFSRPFTGLVEAKISVGYKYTGCSRVVWEHRAVLVSGMELAPAQLGQWSLDRVHAYDYNKGVLHRGDGATEYLSQRPWTSSTVAGTGARRDPLTCPIPADSSSSPQPDCQRSLQSPVALAAAPDGSLIIGDGRYLRILQWLSGSDSDSEAGGRRSDQLKTLAELPTGFETATYHLASDASRSHGSLAVYISDPTSRQLWLVLQRRPERPRRILLAGSGEPCYADDADDCGDGGPAASARLSSPKGVAVDRRGVVYFADGASIRRLVPTTSNSAVEDGAIVETVAGHRRGGFAANDEPPLPCGRVTIRARDLRLRWPTSLAYNQVDDCVYFIEDRSVLRLTADGFAHIVAGRPPHCSATVAKADSQRPLARDDILRRPRAIAFSALGELLIAETVDNGDGGSSGSVRVLRADGRLHRLTGHQPASGSFKSVSALAVSPLGEVFLADPASWLVSRMFYELPRPSPIDGSFQVLSADGSELFTFSKDGKHLSTWDPLTGLSLFNFSHSYDNRLTSPVQAVESSEGRFELASGYPYSSARLLRPGGSQLAELGYANSGQLVSLTGGWRFEYDNRWWPVEAAESPQDRSVRGCLTGVRDPAGRVWRFDYQRPSGRLAAVAGPDGLLARLRNDILTDEWESAARARSSFEGGDGGAGIAVGAAHGAEGALRLWRLDQPLRSMSVAPDGSYKAALSCPGCHIETRRQTVALPDRGPRLLTTERVLRLAGPNATHRLAWIYRSGGRRQSASLIGRSLTINGRSVISVAFDRNNLTEIYSVSNNGTESESDQQQLFSITYNRDGNPISIVPNQRICLYRPVRFDYTSRGRIALMQWADKPRTASESNIERGTYQWQYDSLGRLVSEIRQFSDSEAANELAVYRYSYSDNSTTLPNTVTDPLGNLHTFHLNANGNFGGVTSPEGVRQSVLSQSIVGGTRLHYRPWQSGRAALFDFDSAETLTTLAYPSRQRLLANSFLAGELPRRLALSVHGLTRTEFSYHPDTKLLYRAAVTDQLAETSVRQQFNYRGGCLASESVELVGGLASTAESGLAPVHHRYTLDAELRLVSIETVVGGSGGSIAARTVVNTTLDPVRGHVTGQLDIRFQYEVSRMKHTITLQDGRAMRRFHFDSMGRLVENTLHFASGPGSGFDARAFVLSLHSCSLGRPERLVYGLANEAQVSLEYAKDRLGRPVQLTQAQRGQVTSRQRIIYRGDGRIAARSIESPPPAAAEWLNYTYDSRGLPTSVGSVGLGFDADGFLSWRRNRKLPGHTEHFRFNAKGQLLRADCVADGGTQVYSLHYLYDSRDRLVARLDLLDRSRDFQLMYADPASPWRVSHAFFPHGNRLATFVYENRTGQLVAMETNGERAYIVCDHLGSPLALLDSRGIALNQLSYSHTGLLTVSKQTAQLPFGYRGGIHDPDAQLVLLPPGQRVYDPLTGQWAAPDYSGLARRLHAGLGDSPLGLTNLDGLTFDHLAGEADAAYDSLAVSRPNFWLANFNVRPEASTATIVSAMDSTAGSSLTSPLAGLRDSPTSVLSSALADSLAAFQRLSMIEKIDSGSGGGLALNSTGPTLHPGLLLSVDYGESHGDGWSESRPRIRVSVPEFHGDQVPQVVKQLAMAAVNGSELVPFPGLDGDKQVVHLAWPERAGLMNTHLQAVFGSSVDLTRSRFELPGDISLTISRSDGSDRLLVSSRHSVLSISYGVSVSAELTRLQSDALTAASLVAWQREATAAARGLATRHRWSSSQLVELRSRGSLPGFQLVAPALTGPKSPWQLSQLLALDPDSLEFVSS